MSHEYGTKNGCSGVPEDKEPFETEAVQDDFLEEVAFKGVHNMLIAECYSVQVLTQVLGGQALSGQHVRWGD